MWFLQQFLPLLLFMGTAQSFTSPSTASKFSCGLVGNKKLSLKNLPAQKKSFHTPARLSSNDDDLGEKFGGYTAKQRLREEVESPFRKVRLIFFGFSSISALLALYFSSISAFKAYTGGFLDAPPLDEALTSCGINAVALVVCAFLTYRDYLAGEASLARIAKGGALARLRVAPATGSLTTTTLADYRRNSRVVIAAGGANYISALARSLNSEQLADENKLPSLLADVDVVVVPVLLEGNGIVGDTGTCWRSTIPDEEVDRNFDLTRSNEIIALPIGNPAWADYLKDEIETARGQGFDVIGKGFTITVKKNGRILRRATGQPQWGNFIGAMEVMDGSKFGMPGDSERYGGP